MGVSEIIVFSSPPAKIDKVALRAPRSPPETGASME